MGYTHYWTFNAPKRGTTKQANANFKKAILACQKIVFTYNIGRVDETRLAGYTAHTKPGQYGGLNFNGTAGLSHETFAIREHLKDNVADGGNFCKTAQKPYDDCVVACLIVLKHFLGDNIAVNSDGNVNDWFAGLQLARKILGIKTLQIPASINNRIHFPMHSIWHYKTGHLKAYVSLINGLYVLDIYSIHGKPSLLIKLEYETLKKAMKDAFIHMGVQ